METGRKNNMNWVYLGIGIVAGVTVAGIISLTVATYLSEKTRSWQ